MGDIPFIVESCSGTLKAILTPVDFPQTRRVVARSRHDTSRSRAVTRSLGACRAAGFRRNFREFVCDHVVIRFATLVTDAHAHTHTQRRSPPALIFFRIKHSKVQGTRVSEAGTANCFQLFVIFGRNESGRLEINNITRRSRGHFALRISPHEKFIKMTRLEVDCAHVV